jgi:indolepyruvate ferredoxin oxidoreductase alpha subunit
VVIAREACVMSLAGRGGAKSPAPVVTDACCGCRHCIERFECPAIGFDDSRERAVVDAALCTGCGVCRHVCPLGAFRFGEEGGGTP